MASKRTDALRNRAHLLGVAREMMRKSSVAPAFNELARRAGVGVGTVYRHFADQPALLAGLMEEQLSQFEALMARARAVEDPFEAVAVLFRGALELELESPVIAQMLSAPRQKVREAQRQVDALEVAAEGIVSRARKAKVIRADLAPGDFRRLVCGLERAVRAGHLEEGAERYLDIVLAGLRR